MDVLSFIARYEAILKDRHIKKGNFYAACEITDAAVSQWRRGKTLPSTKTIQRIADYLDICYEYLVTGIVQKEKPAAQGSEPDITFNDFTYAMYNESKELTEENKKKLLEMAKFFKQQQDKEKGT